MSKNNWGRSEHNWGKTKNRLPQLFVIYPDYPNYVFENRGKEHQIKTGVKRTLAPIPQLYYPIFKWKEKRSKSIYNIWVIYRRIGGLWKNRGKRGKLFVCVYQFAFDQIAYVEHCVSREIINMANPSKASNNHKTKAIGLRVSPDTLDYLRAASETDCRSVSSYVSKLIANDQKAKSQS